MTAKASLGQVSPDIVTLPAPRTTGSVSLDQALAARRSVREFASTALTWPQIGQLLWAAQGITHDDVKRTAPSAGATYPLATCRFPGHVDIRKIYEFFLHPPHTDRYRLAWSAPDTNGLFSFLVIQHAFSSERVRKAAQRLEASFEETTGRSGTLVAHA